MGEEWRAIREGGTGGVTLQAGKVMGGGVREHKREAQHSGKKSAATWEEERGDTGDSAATEEGHTPAREGAAARKEGRERGHSAPQLAGDGTAR